LLRECDQIARFGGEEFVVVLPGTTVAEARLVAARIQASLKNAQTDLPLCTLSVGIASNSQPDDDFDHLLQRADAALYRAKITGVTVSSRSCNTVRQRGTCRAIKPECAVASDLIRVATRTKTQSKSWEDISEIVITFCVIPKQKQKGKGCFYVDY
jgi:GGDEF domain-containing protein